MAVDETVDRPDEVLGHRVHQRPRRERHAPMSLEEPNHPRGVHQARLVQVEIHPVDALQLENHVLAENLGHRPG